MIVVDTNIIVPLWIPTDDTEEIERLLEADDHWCAPLLWRSEFRNVMLGYVRRRRLAAATAIEITSRAEQLMRDREYRVPSDTVIRRALASPCSAYDCEFVVLAEQLNVPLVTRDRQVQSAFRAVAVSPTEWLERA